MHHNIAGNKNYSRSAVGIFFGFTGAVLPTRLPVEFSGRRVLMVGGIRASRGLREEVRRSVLQSEEAT